jgi:hypothetical protein
VKVEISPGNEQRSTSNVRTTVEVPFGAGFDRKDSIRETRARRNPDGMRRPDGGRVKTKKRRKFFPGRARG